jgi:hypothetical protein
MLYLGTDANERIRLEQRISERRNYPNPKISN